MELYDLSLKNNQRISPYCWRVKMMLKAKNLEFTTIPVKFTDKPLLAPFGTKLVPVLTDGDETRTDSLNILAYLDEKYPQNPMIRCLNELKIISHWVEISVHLPIRSMIVWDIYQQLHEADKEYFRESREKKLKCSLESLTFEKNAPEGQKQLERNLKPIVSILETENFIGGNKPSATDLLIFGAFMWARESSPNKVLPDSLTSVENWFERMLSLYDGYARSSSFAD